MNIRGLIVSILFTGVILVMTAVGQEKEYEEAPADVSFGLFASYDIASHRPDFNALETIATCCPARYPETSGHGRRAGVFLRLPLFGRLFAEFRGGVRELSAVFEQQEMIWVAGAERDTNNIQQRELVPFTHRIDATPAYADLGVGLGWRVIGGLTVHGGAAGSVWLRKAIRYRESMPDDLGIQYDNGAPYQRNTFEGNLASITRFPFEISCGVGYTIPIDNREHLFLEPSVVYHHGMNSIIEQSDGRWLIRTISLGLAIRYAPLGIPTPPTVPPTPGGTDPPRPE